LADLPSTLFPYTTLFRSDKRTPEGFYWLDWRKTSEKFNLAMHISYPNISDAARSRREGVDPGGMIMIHGTPDTEDNPEQLFHTLDRKSTRLNSSHVKISY